MELRLQLHFHTTKSIGTRIDIESIIKPKQAVDILAKNNIDVVAVTDHDTTKGCSVMRKYAEKKGILVINGIEFSTADGHLIGLGIDEGIEKIFDRDMDASETVDIIKDNGGVVYIPHPFDIKKEGIGVKVKEIDGIIEVFNPFNIFGFEDRLADIAAYKLERPRAVGGDAHIPRMITSGITVIESEMDELSILKTLRKGKTTFEYCRYITLEEIKEWSLDRINSSYDSIMENILENWFVDSWYMNLANLRPFKLIEKGLLRVATNKRESKFWDLFAKVSYMVADFYGHMTMREFSDFIITL